MPIFPVSKYFGDPASGKVLGFEDANNPGHYLLQANPSFQLAAPSKMAAYKGQLGVTWTGAEYYVSNRPPSFWTFYSNGPMSSSVFLTQTGGAGANKLIHEASSSFGIQLLIRSNDLEIQFGVYRSSLLILNAAKAALGTPQHISVYADSAASPSVSVKCTGQTAATGAIPGTAATPDQTLVVGGRAGTPALGFVGTMCMLGAWSPNTAEAVSARASWGRSEFGIDP